MSAAAVNAGESGGPRRSAIQTYARIAGVLALLSLVAGGFGEAYVPSKVIVATDAAATLANLKSFDLLFRLGFAAYLVEACCDISLALIFYVLLKPVERYLSLLAAFFGLIGTAIFACAELFYLAPTLLLRGAASLSSFSPDQIQALALLSFKMFAMGAAAFTAFYGIAWVLRGYLMYHSGYFPKFLGLLMTLAGFAFIGNNFAVVLAPGHRWGWLLLLMLPGLLSLIVWLLLKGVDLAKWEEKTAGSRRDL